MSYRAKRNVVPLDFNQFRCDIMEMLPPALSADYQASLQICIYCDIVFNAAISTSHSLPQKKPPELFTPNSVNIPLYTLVTFSMWRVVF